MKNVFESIDHNSQLYSRIYLDQLIPLLAQVSYTDASAAKRVVKAKALLWFESQSPIEVSTNLSKVENEIAAFSGEPQATITAGETI
jgi:hypothetical protein